MEIFRRIPPVGRQVYRGMVWKEVFEKAPRTLGIRGERQACFLGK